MKIVRTFLILIAMAITPSVSSGFEGVIASSDAIELLKADLLSGKIQSGQTRLMDIRKNYGDAVNINITNRLITYDYGGIKLVFEKIRYWRAWEYDGFKDPAYSDDIDDLRYDLESKELVGDNITYKKILRQYDAPTESLETYEDGKQSIYYYGDIKMIFENYFVLNSWQGSVGSSDNLSTE